MTRSDFLDTKKHLVNLSVPRLLEEAIRRNEGCLSNHGALLVNTGKYTGRSPNDKFTVCDETTKDTVWWNKNNKPMTPEHAEALFQKVNQYLLEKPRFALQCRVGASEEHHRNILVVCERAWHAMFAHNMFISENQAQLANLPIDFTVYHAPGFLADPKRDNTMSEVAVVLDFSKKRIVICGSEYAGEIKKSVFTAMNYLLPEKGVLGMHCSANQDAKGNVAIFFGLSGTGKTTLSADPNRALIGDDEHGWDEKGVFNFEGGCYAKVINLNPKDEPEIFQAIQTFGTILENVVFDPKTGDLDLSSAKYTENTRASYDIKSIPNIVPDKRGGHPKHVVMLTCDAFGVLPPIAKLSPAQASYHFLNGYTARVAGTERGVTEPQAVFSACFGAPFMARPPAVYAHLLEKKLSEHRVQCWLVNTGWTGGPHGVGSRMKITWTRALLNAALSGELERADFVPDPIFRILVPKDVPGVPSNILNPKSTWKDPKAYNEMAKKLVQLFNQNFEGFSDEVSAVVREQGPRFE